MPNGTTFCGFLSSPLTFNEASPPANAKNSNNEASPNFEIVGSECHCKLSIEVPIKPAIIRIVSGTNLIRVLIFTILSPCLTPKILTKVKDPKTNKKKMALKNISDKRGKYILSISAMALAIAASAKIPTNQNMVLAKKPA